MSETSQNNTDNQEIDLSQISKKIGTFFEKTSTRIFKGILFLKRNIIWIGVWVVLGVGLGIFLDENYKSYNSQLIVTPNFGSTDYLYAKIDLINSKITNGDSLFLRDVVGVKNTSKLVKIEIEPIVDVYKFIDNKAQNFELIKLMAEDGDIKKIVTETLTSKNYPFHLVSLITIGQTSNEKTVTPILKYLNDSDYYKTLQNATLNNVKIKMTENDSIISQINGILNTFSTTVNNQSKSDKLVYYNENSQLDQVIKTKDALLSEQGGHRLELVSYDKVIKETSVTLNIKNTSGLSGKMKVILPILFLFLFIGFGFLRSFYKKQMAKLNTES